MSGSVVHRCKTREVRPGGPFFAYCKPRRGKCDYVGPRHGSYFGAWVDARKHDPDFPQGDTEQERRAA